MKVFVGIKASVSPSLVQNTLWTSRISALKLFYKAKVIFIFGPRDKNVKLLQGKKPLFVCKYLSLVKAEIFLNIQNIISRFKISIWAWKIFISIILPNPCHMWLLQHLSILIDSIKCRLPVLIAFYQTLSWWGQI